MIEVKEILDKLQTTYSQYKNIKVGLAGSFANGVANEDSDIDVVIDGDSTHTEIEEYIKSLFNIPVDILWMEILKQNDEELDNFALSLGLDINHYSVYKTIIHEIIWVWINIYQ